MKIEQIPTDKLIPYARNAKKHDAEQVSKIAGSIREFGFNNPVLIDKDNGIIAGHGRVMAAQKLELDEVPCIRLGHLTDTQRKAYILADNRLAEVGGGWDQEILKLELAELGDLAFDLDSIGFGAEDLVELEMEEEAEKSDADAEPQIDKAEELRAKWGVEPGQLWELGDHRLLCGDSTKKEDVERVMGGECAKIMVTDPPYGMDLDADYSKIGNKSHVPGRRHAQIIGDDKKFSATPLFELFGCDEMFLFGADYYSDTIQKAFNGSWLVWDKRVEERYDEIIGSAFELIWSRRKRKREIIRHEYCSWASRTKDTVGGKKAHPTMKPVEVIVRLIQMAGDGVFIAEPFSGSGTTIIACEQLGRKARAIEISPAYVAVAIQRWADATGKTPRKL
jgi:DNA modification methylase